MTRLITTIFTLLVMVSAPAGFAQSTDPVEELQACARITDRDARLAYLDNFGQRVPEEGSTDQEPSQDEVPQPDAETKATATNAQPLPDDLGVAESKAITYSGTITSCKKGYYGDWYFIFDNGEVWKEANKRNRRFKECNFNVTITKDMFGHKMRIDAMDKTIRVKRHQ